jgi:ParB/RepB/Spo0J family partition protein
MSTTLAAHLVAHEQLLPSLTNPRKRFDESRLQELADSMKPPVGILEPLVVRPLPPADGRAKHLDLSRGPFYEIVAGERRWRAAKMAQLPSIPIVVRDIPDEQVITLQLVENKNREDIHPLEEAEAMDRLLKINKTVTPKSLAATIGMSERYVQNRLHYTRLVGTVKEAFRSEKITAGHADLLVRLKPDDQVRALKACFTETFDYDNGFAEGDAVDVEDEPGPAKRREQLVSVRELDRWIKGSIALDVGPKSAELDFFPDVKAAVATPAAAPPTKGAPPAPSLLQVTDSYEYWGKDKPAPLTRNEWTPVEKKKCEHALRAVIVLGRGRGEVLDICLRSSGCKVHFPPAPTADKQKDRKLSKWELAAKAKKARGRRWGKIRALAFAAVKAKAKGITLARALPVLNYGINRWHATAANTSLDKLVVAAVENDIKFIREDTFAKHVAKPLGIDLKALERQAFPPKTKPAAKKPAAKKAPKRKAGAKK